MMLSVNKINSSYQDLQVLWDVSFNIEEGEIIALVGANAAGKSTILNAIAGVKQIDSGSIDFQNMRVDGMPTHKIVGLGLSLIPEGRRLFPEMTVRENLEMGAYGMKVWRDKAQTLDMVYGIFPILKERNNQLARTLSGGEQQMVAIGRGLMSQPKLCMFDEPCLGLSPMNLREIFRVIKELREMGTTILVVEQNVQQTLGCADRAYVLENGRIVMEGPGEELIKNEHIKTAYLGL
jgi:branched-chain amino acid transport system ATP-binding protein